jgi:hypothetical protein
MLILAIIPWRVFIGMLTADIAARAGRSPFWWGVLGGVFGIFALLVALCLRPKRRPTLAARELIEPRLERDDGAREEPWLELWSQRLEASESRRAMGRAPTGQRRWRWSSLPGSRSALSMARWRSRYAFAPADQSGLAGLVSDRHAAVILGVPVTRLRRWRQLEIGTPVVRLGGRVGIRRAEALGAVDRWIRGP